MNDKQFATTLMVIMGVLIGSTIAILALANVLISDTDYSEDPVIQGNIEERIKPIGALAINGVNDHADKSADSSSTAAAEQVADASLSAEQLYTGCAACHDSGVLNAPKLGDKAAWESRIAKGIDQLYSGAINGIGGMPPKGGRADYSDDDIKKAVDYMLESVQ